MRLPIRRGNVLHNEDLLAWPDEAQIAPRDFFDCCRIFFEAPRLFPQACVFRMLARHIRRKLLVLMPGVQHRDETLFPDKRVSHNDDGDQDKQDPDNLPCAAHRFRLRAPAPRGWPVVVVCHVRSTVHRSASKYN